MATVAPLTSYTYAAGTCALRLTGQVSPLSELADRTVLRRSRFQLQLWEEAEFDLNAETSEVSPSSSSGRPPIFDLSGREPQLTALTTLVQRYVHTYLQGQTLTPTQGLSQGDLSLAPVGLTRHRLTVAEEDTAQPVAVNLSILQLADLAEVLTQAEQAVDHVPEAMVASVQRRSRLPSRLPLWAGSVAAVLVAAVLGGQWLTQAPVSVMQSPQTAREAGPESDPGPDSFALESDPTDDLEGATGARSAEVDPIVGPDQEPSAADQPALGDAPADDIAIAPPPAAPRPDPPDLPTIARESRPAPPRPATPRPETAPPATVPPSLAPEGIERRGEGLGQGERPGQAAQTVPRPEVADRLPAATEMAPSPLAASAPPDEATWVDALRRTIQDAWTPIPGLTTPLQYRITLGPTGEVLEIEPLNAPSRQYLDSETLPVVGTVIPNVVRSQPATVEVQLLPSGEVLVQP